MPRNNLNRVVHAPNADGTDYTLCGVADEEMEEGEGVDDVFLGQTIGTIGEKVTCESCLGIIDWAKKFKNNKIPSE